MADGTEVGSGDTVYADATTTPPAAIATIIATATTAWIRISGGNGTDLLFVDSTDASAMAAPATTTPSGRM